MVAKSRGLQHDGPSHQHQPRRKQRSTPHHLRRRPGRLRHTLSRHCQQMTRPKKLRSGPRSADRARSNHQLPRRNHREASQPDPNAGAGDRRTRALRPGKASSAPPPPRLGLAPPTPGSPAAPRRNRRGAPLLDPSTGTAADAPGHSALATHPPASPSPGWDLAAPPPSRSAASSLSSPCCLPSRGPPLVRGLRRASATTSSTRAADLPPPPPRSPCGVSLRAGEPARRADPARRLRRPGAAAPPRRRRQRPGGGDLGAFSV
nr:uncharacterized protein LOC127310795 [Lolium perenne]